MMAMIDFSRALSAEALQAEASQQARARDLAAMLAELAATDWFALRESEAGIAIPEDVRQARIALRQAISELRAQGDPPPV